MAETVGNLSLQTDGACAMIEPWILPALNETS
jgi:hypothetical protein